MNFDGDAFQLLRTTTEMWWCSLTSAQARRSTAETKWCGLASPLLQQTCEFRLRYDGAVRLLRERDDEHPVKRGGPVLFCVSNMDSWLRCGGAVQARLGCYTVVL
ncbi:type VI secretion system tube protein Hcp [Sesbania bispinosa]|nr:type VI secretion system tube protein Hcp [Sesbania bispinosa]